MKYWIETYTGKTFDYESIESNKIVIEDIAHALSNICRFNGHSLRFYSVCEHSILVANEIEKLYPKDKHFILQALLHDATEAYMPDVPKPLKYFWDTKFHIMDFEDKIMTHIYHQLKINTTKSQTYRIKQYDNALLRTESNILFKDRKLWEFPGGTPEVNPFIVGWYPETVEEKFLSYYNKLISN